jgi:TonB family protein
MKKYFLHSNGQHTGPYSVEDLRAMRITPSTPIWHEGLGSWKAASDLPELNFLFTTTAPSFHQPQIHRQFPATSYYSPADEQAEKKKSTRLILLVTGGMLTVIAVICIFAYQKVKENKEAMYERMREREREKEEGPEEFRDLPYDYGTDGIETIEEAPQEIAPTVESVQEEQPQFPGGTYALNTFIRNNIQYPEIAKNNGIQGTVYVSFTVEKNGEVTNPRIVRGVSPELDQEAMRMVKKMPKWKPGTMNGNAVKITMTQPIRFTLQ